MIILGLSCFYHDSSATIIKDGQIIAAAQEERFTRIKHDNTFPYKSIEFCLNSLKIAINEIDYVAFYEKPILKFDRVLNQHIQHFPKSLKVFMDTIPGWINEKLQIKKILKEKCHYHGKVLFINHHLSHIAASFYTSPFQEASFLTLDGVGEWATTTQGTIVNNHININHETIFPHSLGLFYSAITSYLGFAVNNDEYKVMGLSGYGDPQPLFSKVEKLVNVKKNGQFKLNMEYFSFDYREKMYSHKFEQLFGFPPRLPQDPVLAHHKNLAASSQLFLEETAQKILNSLYLKHPNKNLILSGGVFLNSLMNGKILSHTPFKNLYITPDPGDGGGSLGAALFVYHSYLKNKNHQTLSSPYLGPEFDDSQVTPFLKKYKLKYTRVESEKLFDQVSDLIVNQKVIGWFQGRMEWGPRALGNRSILASATKREMMDIINAKVKHREMFRPFAPVILREKTKDYFITDKNLPISSDYMLLVYPFKKQVKKHVPAVVHIDGTGRLQTIDRQTNQKYYDLIAAYYKKTGIPLILNTSFNVKGEPIVCTPKDAIKCFLNTEIDYLVINNYIIHK